MKCETTQQEHKFWKTGHCISCGHYDAEADISDTPPQIKDTVIATVEAIKVEVPITN
jgi:hypothetical protein